MTRIIFSEVTLYSKRTFKCVTCGKRRVRRRKFWQTLNPFNKNPDGTVKSELDISRELAAQIAVWQPTECGCAGTP